MEDNGSRAPARVQPFKGLSKGNQQLLGRFVQDRSEPQKGRNHDVDMSAVAVAVKRTVRDTSDIRNIFRTMPDLNLPRDILVSATVAPGDLATTSLLFEAKVQGTDSQLTSQLLGVLTDYFITEKKMEEKVPEWIDEALIMKGSHPIMIIPESSVDRMVNGAYPDASMEAVASFDNEWESGWFKPKGIFGLRVPTGTRDGKMDDFVSLESSRGRIDSAQMKDYHTIKVTPPKKTSVSLPFRVTDNLAVLRAPAVQEVKRAAAMSRIYGAPTLESRRRERLERERTGGEQQEYQEVDGIVRDPKAGKRKKMQDISDGEVYSRFFRTPQRLKKNRMEVVPTLAQSGGSTQGHPLEYHLPPESVMPVCIPGDPTNHVGYIVVLDGNTGFPIASIREIDYYNELRRGSMGGSEQTGSNSQVAGELLNMANNAINGGISNANDMQLARTVSLCGDLIEKDLVARLKSGLLGGDFEISRTDYIDKLMLARTAKNQMTTLLYVPAECMIYLAYDYTEAGVGKSLLEDAKSLCAMRANLMIAHVLGSAANAIPGKDINIELDPDDADPVGTATFLASEAMALAYNQFPMSISSPQGIAEALQMTSFSVNVTGNPRFPEVKTSITPRESQQVVIDTELMNQMRDDVTRVFSITPEMVDGMNQPDFATTAVNNSLMLLKRVMVNQRKTNPFLSDYARLYTLNSGILVDKMMEVIEANKKFLPKDHQEDPEIFLQEFMNSLTVSLPAPDVDNLEKHMDLYDKFSTGLDKMIEAYLKDEYLDGYASDIVREALPTVIASWKGHQQRKYMRERGIFRELDIFGNAEDGSPLMNLNEEMASHVVALNNALADYSKRVATDAKARKARNAQLVTLDEDAKAAMAGPIDSNADAQMDANDVTGGNDDDDQGFPDEPEAGDNDDLQDGDQPPEVPLPEEDKEEGESEDDTSKDKDKETPESEETPPKDDKEEEDKSGEKPDESGKDAGDQAIDAAGLDLKL